MINTARSSSNVFTISDEQDLSPVAEHDAREDADGSVQLHPAATED
jgi:hypothetical protein